MSGFLNNIGLGNLDMGLMLVIMAFLLLISIILLIVFIVKEEKLRKRYQVFMRGKDAKSLETSMGELFEENRVIKEKVSSNRKEIKTLYKRMHTTFQKIGVVKYDAYQQMGGLLSFALTLLDEDNNGFIMNSVHSAEGCYTYIKNVNNGTCELELGKEEKEALEMAMKTEEEG